MSNCERCRYAGNSNESGNRECHRFPPVGRPNIFPLMHPTDWCGEWVQSGTSSLMEMIAALSGNAGGEQPAPKARRLAEYWAAQHGVTAKETADAIKQLADIEDMLNEGQGDDDGMQIMPDFEDGMSTIAKVEDCLHLLEKRRDVIEGYAGGNWRDDPSADDRWNAGLDYGMTHLCKVLGLDQNSVTWDAATETLDGDVMAVIGNILRAKYGDDWHQNTPAPNAVSGAVREALEAADLELLRAIVLPMVRERSRESGDAWHRAAEVIKSLAALSQEPALSAREES